MKIWKKRVPFWIVPVLLCLLVSCQPVNSPQGDTIAVQRVLSGQEFELQGISGEPDITERVRLAGIAVPNLTQKPWGSAAKVRLEQMILNQSVVLESDRTPRTAKGQRSVYAWLNGVLLNERLVAEGHAITVSNPPKSAYELRLSRAQDRARILGLGVWNPQDPMRQPPGDVSDRE